MQRHNATAIGNGIVIGADHAAFASGDSLSGVEGETGGVIRKS
jgi:hypothetical protein